MTSNGLLLERSQTQHLPQEWWTCRLSPGNIFLPRPAPCPQAQSQRQCVCKDLPPALGTCPPGGGLGVAHAGNFLTSSLSIDTCGRRMGPPWLWRLILGSAWTEMAPYTSRRRGQGTLAHIPAGSSRLVAMTLATPTCVSGKGKGGMGKGNDEVFRSNQLLWVMTESHV